MDRPFLAKLEGFTVRRMSVSIITEKPMNGLFWNLKDILDITHGIICNILRMFNALEIGFISISASIFLNNIPGFEWILVKNQDISDMAQNTRRFDF